MSKPEQIQRTREEFARLTDALLGLNERELTALGIGDWGVRDVLAHIVGWTRVDTEIMRRLARGERPLPEGEDYGTGESRNPGFAEKAAARSARSVLDELLVAFDEFVDAAERGEDNGFAPGRTAQRTMQESACQHIKEHRIEIETWRKTLKTGTGVP